MLNTILIEGYFVNKPKLFYSNKNDIPFTFFCISVKNELQKDHIDVIECKAAGEIARYICDYVALKEINSISISDISVVVKGTLRTIKRAPRSNEIIVSGTPDFELKDVEVNSGTPDCKSKDVEVNSGPYDYDWMEIDFDPIDDDGSNSKPIEIFYGSYSFDSLIDMSLVDQCFIAVENFYPAKEYFSEKLLGYKKVIEPNAIYENIYLKHEAEIENTVAKLFFNVRRSLLKSYESILDLIDNLDIFKIDEKEDSDTIIPILSLPILVKIKERCCKDYMYATEKLFTEVIYELYGNTFENKRKNTFIEDNSNSSTSIIDEEIRALPIDLIHKHQLNNQNDILCKREDFLFNKYMLGSKSLRRISFYDWLSSINVDLEYLHLSNNYYFRVQEILMKHLKEGDKYFNIDDNCIAIVSVEEFDKDCVRVSYVGETDCYSHLIEWESFIDNFTTINHLEDWQIEIALAEDYFPNQVYPLCLEYRFIEKRIEYSNKNLKEDPCFDNDDEYDNNIENHEDMDMNYYDDDFIDSSERYEWLL